MTRERRRVVRLGDAEIALDIDREDDGARGALCDGDGKRHVVSSDWKPGDPLWSGTVDGRPVAVQVRPVLNGFDLSHRGVESAPMSTPSARRRPRA